MNVYLLRHGETAYNAEKRYQGWTDIPLSPAGIAKLCPADVQPEVVHVSPLLRARQTAELLFPGVKQIAVPGLREMNFGRFEGRNYIEMEHDPDYRAWVDTGCEGRCPDGESKAEFSRRVCGAFAALVEDALERGTDPLVIVAHGGTQMAALERYALPRRSYYDWRCPCGGGFVLETDKESWQVGHMLQYTGTVVYNRIL